MWAVPTTQVHKVNVAIIPYTDTCTLQLHYIEEGVERETRYRWHSIGIAAEQAAFVWAYAANRRWWLGEKIMEYEVEGPRPRGRPKRTWRKVVREDWQARKMNKEDATDHCKWRKMIKDVRWSGWVWVGECFFWYQPTRVVPDQNGLNGCVCYTTLNYIEWMHYAIND